MAAMLSLSRWVVALLGGATLFCGLPGCAQPASQSATHSLAMEPEQREREVERVRQALEQSQDVSATVLRRYMDTRPEELRRDLYALFWRMGTVSQEQPRRAAFVEYLLGQAAAETPMLRGQILKWLQDFRKEDFNENAVRILTGLPWTEQYCPELIRLIGIAELPHLVLRLQAEVANHPLSDPPPPGYYNTNTWAALLALARQGDEQALAEVIRRVRGETDIVVRATILFSDLGHTRRPRAFDVLRDYLNSNERLPRVKDNVPGRMEAARAAAVFSKYIKGFPIQETDFTEAQTLQARAWVNAQTSWEFK